MFNEDEMFRNKPKSHERAALLSLLHLIFRISAIFSSWNIVHVSFFCHPLPALQSSKPLLDLFLVSDL